MVFFVAIFALLVAASLRFSPHGFLDCLSMDSSKSLRGICTFAIIIHHFSQSFGEKSILTTVFLGVGYLSVAVFFFFSGYGLMKSFQLKPDYQNSFLSRRFLTILIPYCFFILLYWAVNSLFGTSYSVSDILISLLVGHPWRILPGILLLRFTSILRFIS